MLKHFRRIVVNASVARAAGGERAIFPTSRNCRDFLAEILNLGHFVIMTTEIRKEWNKHCSLYSLSWLAVMTKRRKQIILPNVENDELRQKIITNAPDNGSRKAMIEDIILIEAAMCSDNTIASLDETVRKKYKKISIKVTEIGQIIWVNPDKEDEKPIIWLRQGANPDEERKLGYQLPLA